jgi:cell division septum initiation protein DivIVA
MAEYSGAERRRQQMHAGYRPVRYWLLGAGAVLLLLAGFALYELGMMRAGYNRLQALEAYDDLRDRFADLETDNKRLRERAAVLETAAKIDKEAYRQVEAQLIDLQTEIQNQTEDLEFYKQIVNANEGSGLRIQDFRIVRNTGERNYNLRVVLAQALRTNQKISGQVDLVIEGLRGGEADQLDVAGLIAADKGSGSLKFGFRYFQDLQANVTIPADFEPQKVVVKARPAGKSSKTVEEFFVWTIKPG